MKITEYLFGLHRYADDETLQRRLNLTTSRLSELQEGAKPSRSEQSKIIALSKRLPVEQRAEVNLKAAPHILGINPKLIKAAKRVKATTPDLQRLNEAIEQKRLRANDVTSITGVGREQYKQALKSGRIDPRSVRTSDGRLLGKNNLGEQKVLVKQTFAGKSRISWMKTSAVNEYIQYKTGQFAAPYDHWESEDYSLETLFV